MNTPQHQHPSEPHGFIFTPRAIEHTLMLATQSPHQNFSALRIYLAGKICDGFTYGVQFDEPLATDQRFELFAGHQRHEFKFNPHQVPLVICDAESYPFLRGSTIDYVDDERGQGYLITNPRHSDYAGKFYKDPNWQTQFKPTTQSSPPQS